jgi:hypothetical protein
MVILKATLFFDRHLMNTYMTFGITHSINVLNGMKGLHRCTSVGAMAPPIFGEKIL